MPATASDRLNGLTTSVAVKAPVDAVSTTNLTLSGLQTVGGVVLAENDRVLVWQQTDATENGIYVASSSDWTRAKDFDGNRDVVKGTLVVYSGDTSVYYRVTTSNPIVIDTSEIDFEVVGTAVTQASIGAVLYPISTAESNASVAPVNLHYPWYDFPRYGDVTGTDDTTMFSNWLKAAAEAGAAATNSLGRVTVAIDPIELKTANNNIPPVLNLNGMTIQAKSGSDGVLFTVENPHADYPQFQLNGGGATFDANDVCSYPFKLHGCQWGAFRSFFGVNGTSGGIWLKGESGYGIYYNEFTNLQGGVNGSPNNGHGIIEDGTGANYFIASNVFMNCRAQFNKGHGWYIDYSNNPHIGCEAEKNDTYGAYHDHVFSCDWFGGYMEHNHQNYATGVEGDPNYTGDGGSDENFSATANSTGLKIIGGRHIGTPAGTWTGLGNRYEPGYSGVTNMPNLDTAGKFTINSMVIRSGGGLNYSSGTPSANTQNWADQHVLAVSGTSMLQFNNTIATDETGLLIRHFAGGSAAFERVSVGAADSGGSGFRLLRIPN